MKVFYDHQVFSWQRFGGVSRYFVELVNHLPGDVEAEFPAMLTENVYLGSLGESAPETRKWNFGNFRVRKQLYERVDRVVARRRIVKGGFDLLHPTYYDPYFMKRRKVPYVITVHDFIHEKYPDFFRDASKVIANKRRVIEGADGIIAISEHTKHDLVEIYGIDPSRVEVIYHGASPLSSTPMPVEGVTEPYVLFVGDRTKYKSFDVMLEGFAGLHRRQPEYRLICAGTPFSVAEEAVIAKMGLSGSVRAVTVNDHQLARLYGHAACFVFPSAYEGFGLPILEAWSAGAPVVLRDASCFPEIGGDAAVYFDGSGEELSGKMEEVIVDAGLRSRLREASDARLRDFTWEKTARLTADVYRKIIK